MGRRLKGIGDPAHYRPGGIARFEAYDVEGVELVLFQDRKLAGPDLEHVAAESLRTVAALDLMEGDNREDLIAPDALDGQRNLLGQARTSHSHAPGPRVQRCPRQEPFGVVGTERHPHLTL